MSIEPPEIIRTKSERVVCDGGGNLGHPRVYLSLKRKGKVECPYCDRLYIHESADPKRTGS